MKRRSGRLIWLVGILWLGSLCAGCAAAPEISTAPLRVYYAGPENRVATALELASGSIELVAQPEQAEVLLVVDEPANLELVQAGLARRAGVVLLSGEQAEMPALASVIDLPQAVEASAAAISLEIDPAAPETGSLLTQVVWTSAPQVRERLVVESAQLLPLVRSFESGETILGRIADPARQIYVLTARLGAENQPFQDWAYFNYFVYTLVSAAGERESLSFGQYPAAPVPHQTERLILFGILGAILLTAGGIFLVVRRYSLAHPEVLERIVVDNRSYTQREADSDWEQIGFHRPLGGFLLALLLGLVGFIPLIIYQNLVLPVYLLPSAQALGIWGRVTQFFNLLWLFFDLGTSAAFIKFFSQYRVHNPRRAIQFGQVFIWWQMLSGAIQVALVVAVSGIALPESAFAIYAWSVIIHAFIQLPGFFQVMRHSLIAWQRFDYAQILDLALALIFPILVQPVFVLVMVAWGRSNPVFGMAMGGLLGMGLAAYAAEALTFLVGLWLYRRLGYSARLLFMAHFDRGVLREAFGFGVFEMLGSIAWGAGQALEIVITQTRLLNYAEVWGNWVLAQNFVYAFNVLQTLYANIMPSISEAISHARRALSQYYAVMAYKYGGIISAFIGAVLLAVGDRFILGASGPEFVRAAVYVVPLTLWGAIQFASWVGDEVQLASNRPYLKSALVASEQVLRVTLAWLLLERLQINALILAYFIGLLAKGIGAYLINHRLCFPQRYFAWQSLFAPLLAGAVHYGLLRWLTGFIWQQDQLSSVLIFFIGILPSYPIYMFFYGLFGGWDADTLAELRQAADLAGFMRPLARLFYWSTALGARWSPLHGRFPITIRAAALIEARTLTNEKVDLLPEA